MNQEKRYEAPDIEVYSFSSTDVIMDCGSDSVPCPSYNDVCISDGQCYIDIPSCIMDGICPADGYCFTENTSTNG